MLFIADLHIHSRFSLATSKALNIPHLAAWARRKGIDALGTGDFTHPKWRKELAENLVFDEETGFYKPRYGLSDSAELPIGGSFSSQRQTHFCLQAEISSIYKRDGKTRKIHNLVFMPNLEAAEKFCKRLELIGNLNSDGRPILGLDSRDLLEITLETHPDAILIPAHIWTPWFSLFGSRSGFDRVEDCYADLTPHIFAMETGLSSDPPMNRCWGALDGYAMISNSDAHSGANLGREANLFSGVFSRNAMFSAMRQAAARKAVPEDPCNFLGTLELYPEEGKYHLDGHRACDVALEPQESAKLNNICPVCNKKLTIGVLHRVMELADRAKPAQLPLEPETRMMIPLPEVIGQIMGASAQSRAVAEKTSEVVKNLGPELYVLCLAPEKEIRAFWEPLGEAVARLRRGEVDVQPGYDGEYGRIGIFSEAEIRDFGYAKKGGHSGRLKSAARERQERKLDLLREPEGKIGKNERHFDFSKEQLAAVEAIGSPIFVAAGPGAGKTRVLIGRIIRLLREGTAPDDILALAFTRRAANEMRARLKAELSEAANLPVCDTIHGFIWRRMLEQGESRLLLGENDAKSLFFEANSGIERAEAENFWNLGSIAREELKEISGPAGSAWEKYKIIKDNQCLDFGDLQDWQLANPPANFYKHLLLDEAQDLSPAQLEIIRRLVGEDGEGFFGIGDPDQGIYGFRGAGKHIFEKMASLWPKMQRLALKRSFRSAQKILDMAENVFDMEPQCGKLQAVRNFAPQLTIFSAVDEYAEARWIAEKISQALGPTAHTLSDGKEGFLTAPGDIAILTRLKAQMPLIRKFLQEKGIPCSSPALEAFWENEQCAKIIEKLRDNRSLNNPDSALEKMLEDSNPDVSPEIIKRSDSFRLLKDLWQKSGNRENFFQELAWRQEAEMLESKAQRVQIMTLHASKGLEFDIVFLPGLENGLLPFKGALLGSSLAGDAMEDEEKRLLYVGITRAARAVYISHAGKRGIYGKRLNLEPSPFMAKLEPFCSQTHMAKRTRLKSEKLSLF